MPICAFAHEREKIWVHSQRLACEKEIININLKLSYGYACLFYGHDLEGNILQNKRGDDRVN